MIVTKTPCPVASAELTKMDNDDAHACCNDSDTIAKTGKSCKAEKECQPASPGMIQAAESRLSVLFGGEKFAVPSIAAPSFYLPTTWRPPSPA